jgi:glycosyltransferase
MASSKQLSIVIPSFRDERIVDTIASVRAFDDLGTVRIVVIDGGSDASLIEAIRPLLGADDVLVSEPDKGIFDALNKGLDRVETPYLGWLGSDDLYTRNAKSSKVVAALETHDLYVMDLVLVRDGHVRRRTHSWPCAKGLVRFGLHNPHYSTFGRSALLCKHRFRLDLTGSDIDYFLRVFAEKPRVMHDPAVGMLMAEGGFSTGGYGKMVRSNGQLFDAYRAQSGRLGAAFALALKMGYKAIGILQHKVIPRDTAPFLQPELESGKPHPARIPA